MTLDLLQDDCRQCAALCCVALAFDKSLQFASDKDAGVPCQNLTPDMRCGIHAKLAEAGYPGCVAFTCHGAGQRVVQDCFDGRDWRSDPALLPRMMDSFQAMRKLHALILLLTEASRLPLSDSYQDIIDQHLARLSPDGPITEDWLNDRDMPALEKEVHQFLRSLAPALQEGGRS
ncbi:hypothetical protein ACJ5NV_03315 [Loktanella agnita]|uniref:hypothetical protein n=1 Tax=Loktanella agnita TaxID=287097 RepID=UPI003986DEE1